MIVVERRLDTVGGHYRSQLDAIRRFVEDRAVTFVAAREFQAHGADMAEEVIPLLSSYKEIKKCPNAALDHDVAAFAQIVADRSFDRSDAVLIPTAEHPDIRLCLQLAAQGPHPKRFYLRVLLERTIAGLSDDERKQLRQAVASGRIVLLAETITMSAHLSALYDMRFSQTVLCLPCAVKSIPVAATKMASRAPAQRYRIGIMGSLRPEKGALMVPKIIRHLRRSLSDLPASPQIDLIFQKARPRLKIKDIRREYRFRRDAGGLARTGNLAICPLPVAMSDNDFVTTLFSVDILLLPYRLVDYRHRGSGIVLDAVAARKPIVHTAGMGMTELLTLGNAEAAAEDPADYADKLLKVLADLDSYAAGADRAACELRRQYKASADLLRSM